MEAKENLSEAEVKKRLTDLPEWKKNGKALQRVVDFQEYLEAIDFVHIIAENAEQINHHPDIEIRHTKVSLFCTTHRCKGITARDFELAHKIQARIGRKISIFESPEERLLAARELSLHADELRDLEEKMTLKVERECTLQPEEDGRLRVSAVLADNGVTFLVIRSQE